MQGEPLDDARGRSASGDARGPLRRRRNPDRTGAGARACETKNQRVNALVFVGDAMEENIDRLCRLAGELGLGGVPIFLFHEGGDPVAGKAFRQIAKLSRGAYVRFDLVSIGRLKELLARRRGLRYWRPSALTAYSEKKGGEVLRLTAQLRG